MRQAIKNKCPIVYAYQLGADSDMERQLLNNGKIRLLPSGDYELFSQETATEGELASPGDYFKVDGAGAPYPNKKDWFQAHHHHIEGNRYEQIPEPLYIWQVQDDSCDVINFLVREGRLTLHPEDSEHYYRAFLWGAPLTAAIDAAVVFYGISRDYQGEITDVSFNFCAADEFQKTYTILG